MKDKTIKILFNATIDNLSSGKCEINKSLLFSELGNHSEQFLLGLIFYEGEIMEENHEKAFYWINKSADWGYSNAQFYLGMMYFCGHGIEKDYNQSFRWLKKSAEQSHSEAEYYLSWHFKNGWGVTEDSEKWEYWLKRSAVHGYEGAQDAVEKSFECGGIELLFK